MSVKGGLTHASSSLCAYRHFMTWRAKRVAFSEDPTFLLSLGVQHVRGSWRLWFTSLKLTLMEFEVVSYHQSTPHPLTSACGKTSGRFLLRSVCPNCIKFSSEAGLILESDGKQRQDDQRGAQK